MPDEPAASWCRQAHEIRRLWRTERELWGPTTNKVCGSGWRIERNVSNKILSTIIGIEDFSVAEISCYYYYVSVSN